MPEKTALVGDDKVSVSVTYQEFPERNLARIIVTPVIANLNVDAVWARRSLAFTVLVPYFEDRYSGYALWACHDKRFGKCRIRRMRVYKDRSEMKHYKRLRRRVNMTKPTVFQADINYFKWVYFCKDIDYMSKVYDDLVKAITDSWTRIKTVLLYGRPDPDVSYEKHFLSQRDTGSRRIIVKGK